MIEYFSKISNLNLVLLASEVVSCVDGVYNCNAAYGVIQFNYPDHVHKVKSADDREWLLRSNFETDVEQVVQRLDFTLEPILQDTPSESA